MAALTANGITLEYEERGEKSGAPLVLIMGLGQQLTAWPEELVNGLAEQGFRVIRFDNRDSGLSTRISGQVPNVLLQYLLARLGIKLQVPYTLGDMAGDTVGLMDALKIESAHIAGVSMGGMIAQIIAGRYKSRVKTLTCMLTTSGNPRAARPQREVIQNMINRPKNLDRETWIDYYCHMFTLIGSPDTDREDLRRRVTLNVDRALYPQGTARQLAAILHNGSRVRLLKEVQAPTLVISGSVDPMVPPGGGRDLAANVKGARFELVEGMGHDLPVRLIPRIVELIAAHAGM
jgi:pimeloyl-ACP methyl ester carboxylesterase